jgi:hypothetical protein
VIALLEQWDVFDAESVVRTADPAGVAGRSHTDPGS